MMIEIQIVYASLKNVWKNQKAGAERKITPDSEYDGKEKDGKEKGWRETFGLDADEIFSALHGSQSSQNVHKKLALNT